MFRKRRALAMVACGAICLGGVLGGAAGAGALSASPAATSASSFKATVIVNTSGTLTGALTSSYIGLSAESGGDFGLNSGQFDDVGNLAQMLRNLGTGVLRFGGNSVDRKQHNAGSSTTILTGLKRLTDASGWKVLYTVNLGQFNPLHPEPATADAANAASILGSSLAAIACGNEPDLYFKNGLRPATYSEGDYLPEEAACLAAIRRGAPGVPVAGPDSVIQTKWLPDFAALEQDRLSLLTMHRYPLSCASLSTGATLAQLAAKVLSSGELATDATTFRNALGSARAAGAKLLIDETALAACGDVPGLSDSEASALFVVGYLLTGAELGLQGMDFHGGLGSSCDGITPLCRFAKNMYSGAPVYYGMLFTHLMGTGSFLPVTVTSPAHIFAFALKPASGTGLRIMMVNPSNATAVTRLQVSGARLASYLSLRGPGLLATSGINIQGAKVATNGTFTPGTASTAACPAGTCSLSIPPYTAVLVTTQ